MSEAEHTHIPKKDSNICEVCEKPIHSFEEPKKFDTKSLSKTADALNGAANKVGIALVLFVVGIFLFPLGIILWLFALGVLGSIFSKK